MLQPRCERTHVNVIIVSIISIFSIYYALLSVRAVQISELAFGTAQLLAIYIIYYAVLIGGGGGRKVNKSALIGNIKYCLKVPHPLFS